MTMRRTSRPRMETLDVSVLRIWPGRVIEDSVCTRLVALSSFTFESDYRFESEAALRRRATGSSWISPTRTRRSSGS